MLERDTGSTSGTTAKEISSVNYYLLPMSLIKILKVGADVDVIVTKSILTPLYNVAQLIIATLGTN